MTTVAAIATDARSWVEGACDPLCHFPLQNLPFGVFSTAENPVRRVGVAIGDRIADLAGLAEAGLLDAGGDLFRQPSLNPFVATGPAAWRTLRNRLTHLLGEASPMPEPLRRSPRLFAHRHEATMHMPVAVRDYTDFYASRHHAQNVGALFRDPAHALLPNWLELPVGYHGRASSVIVSGEPVRRPWGQIRRAGADRPVLAPSERLDFELELGAVVGVPNALGHGVPVLQAAAHVFGLVLLNDWSARDVQQWEAQPLGPFNAKNFATTISPWVVTMDALAPFACAQPVQDPPPLDYLLAGDAQGLAITLEVMLQPRSLPATTIVRTNFRQMYWSVAQMVAHHTVGGCNLGVGDLLGSGTVSGPEPGSCGCLLEQTHNGARPIALQGGQSRSFLEDGDTVTLTGWAQGEGFRIGFGTCTGTIG